MEGEFRDNLLKDLSLGNQLVSDIEPILDHCDALADQLDELDEAGFNITPVGTHYEKLIQWIERLQDAIDGD